MCLGSISFRLSCLCSDKPAYTNEKPQHYLGFGECAISLLCCSVWSVVIALLMEQKEEPRQAALTALSFSSIYEYLSLFFYFLLHFLFNDSASIETSGNEPYLVHF